MDLVTITCLLDLRQMLLQAESISKFVEPCTHWVVINDIEVDLPFWKDKLSKYYKNHRLELIAHYRSDLNNYTGWHRQQAYKFIISRFTNQDYLILDSKNFFIRHCNINEWQGVIGCGFNEDMSRKGNLWIPAINSYAAMLGTSPITECLCMQTPFVFEINEIRKLGDIESFATKFLMQEGLPSEFIFYSHLIKDKMNKRFDSRHKLLWANHRTVSINYFKNTRGNIKVLGIHREYLKRQNSEYIEEINTWLRSIGITDNFL